MTDRRRPRPGPGVGRATPTPPAASTPAAPGAPAAAEPDSDAPLPLVLAAAGTVALVVVAVLGAVVSVLLTPARIGTTLVPFSVALAVVLNIALPLLAFRMTGSRGVAALPVLLFFVTGWALSISPGGDVLLAGGSDGQTATSYATLLAPVVVGAVTAVRAR